MNPSPLPTISLGLSENWSPNVFPGRAPDQALLRLTLFAIGRPIVMLDIERTEQTSQLSFHDGADS